jgi:hypothetical protein
MHDLTKDHNLQMFTICIYIYGYVFFDFYVIFSGKSGLDINVCPIPVKTDVGQVDLILRLSDGTSENNRFPNLPVRRTNLFPLV